ncbi:DgyrCDS910 [Dimorphilus gyrociliatus]|uniref:GTP-binding protein 8 n=1 Tax=Dimorphilus gyrociliatus TaxID=2664684 RepID=A0A7I8V617_9ANNE|nr:DgyrCDS910 [Dimorphilus gyrociliatus]
MWTIFRKRLALPIPLRNQSYQRHLIPSTFCRCFSELSHWKDVKPDETPFEILKQYTSVPLEKYHVFLPPKESLVKSSDLFSKRNEYIVHKGAIHPDKLPDTKELEVALLGQSNVGKSSLIQALYNHNEALRIKTSKKPGHTKVIKIYSYPKNFSLVDMPGFGENMPKYFEECVENYCVMRRQLTRLLLLIDAEQGITDIDNIALDMLEEFNRPYVIVLTKIDKCHISQLIRTIINVQERIKMTLHCSFQQPFLVSSKQDLGLHHLRCFIAYVTGCISIRNL